MKATLIAGAVLALALSVGPAWAQPGAPLVPGAGIRSYPNQPLQYGQRDRDRGDWDRDRGDGGRWDYDDRWRHRGDWDRDDWRDRGSYRWDFDDRWRYRGDRYGAYRPYYGGYGVYPGHGTYRVVPGPGFGYYIRPYGSSYLYPYGSYYGWRSY